MNVKHKKRVRKQINNYVDKNCKNIGFREAINNSSISILH